MSKIKRYMFTPQCTVFGRKDVEISFDWDDPEHWLEDKSLVGLEGDELKQALKKPFIVMHDLGIKIKFEGEEYSFVIPCFYDWNGANVPACAWLFIGQRTDPRFKLASCVHDYMCEHKYCVRNNRYLSSLVFETLCEYFGRFNAVKRWAMFHSVDNFQKFQGW